MNTLPDVRDGWIPHQETVLEDYQARKAAREQLAQTAMENGLPAEIEARSGHLATIVYGEDKFVVSTLYCDCADIQVRVFRNGREIDGNMQAVYACQVHGVNLSAASRLKRPEEIQADHATLRRVFPDWAKSTRRPGVVAWGMSK